MLFLTLALSSLRAEKCFRGLFGRFEPKEFADFQILAKSLRSAEIWPAAAVALEARNFFVHQRRGLIFWLQVALEWF